MKKTVLHLVHKLTAGGAERVLVNLINGSSTNVRHIICSFSPADEFENEIIPERRTVINLNKKSGNDFKLPFRIAAICKEYDVDVVHSQGWATYIEGIFATKLLCRKSIKFIFAFRGKTIADVAEIPRKRIVAQRVFSYLCDGIITPSEIMRQDYANEIGINPDKIQVIYNGINIDQSKSSRLNLDREEFGLPSQATVIGCVARLDPVKNLIWLIRSSAPIIRQFPNIHLLIIGDGPEKQKIEEEILIQELANNIVLPGRRSDVFQCLNLMDIFIQPSVYEGISNTILEAMGSCLPVIATNVGGTPEIVENNVTGILVESNNSKQLSESIIRLMNNIELRKQMGLAGRKLVENQFNGTQMAFEYERLFLSM